MDKDFEKELLELLKKHEVKSFNMLCYNDPELVKQLEDLDENDYNRRYEAWIKDNPEPKYPPCQKYDEPQHRENLSKWLDLFRQWEDNRDAALGVSPKDLRGNLYSDDYCGDYTPGLWYSSKCY